MHVNMLKSKIHRVRVTEADLNYVGSVTVDKSLMEKAQILPGEKVQIVNNNNGERFETYVIEGERDSGIFCLNGAAARLVQPGDVCILIAYCWINDKEAKNHQPTVVFCNEHNRVYFTGEKENN